LFERPRKPWLLELKWKFLNALLLGETHVFSNRLAPFLHAEQCGLEIEGHPGIGKSHFSDLLLALALDRFPREAFSSRFICVRLPTLSLGELKLYASRNFPGRTEADVQDHYHTFGGVLRHMFPDSSDKLTKELRDSCGAVTMLPITDGSDDMPHRCVQAIVLEELREVAYDFVSEFARTTRWSNATREQTVEILRLLTSDKSSDTKMNRSEIGFHFERWAVPRLKSMRCPELPRASRRRHRVSDAALCSSPNRIGPTTSPTLHVPQLWNFPVIDAVLTWRSVHRNNGRWTWKMWEEETMT